MSKGRSNVALEDTLIEIRPSLPFFVVIINTPLAAALPYNAAALAPFRIFKLSISSGLTSDNGSEPSEVLEYVRLEPPSKPV